MAPFSTKVAKIGYSLIIYFPLFLILNLFRQSHFHSIGSPLKCINSFPSLQSQKDRFLKAVRIYSIPHRNIHLFCFVFTWWFGTIIASFSFSVPERSWEIQLFFCMESSNILLIVSSKIFSNLKPCIRPGAAH